MSEEFRLGLTILKGAMSEQTACVISENLIDALANTAVGNYAYAYDANDNKTPGGPAGIGRVAERQDDSHSAPDCG